MLKKRKNSGQAVIELALALPFLIWLIYYTLNAFHMLHTAHVGQKFSAMSLNNRLSNRSKFVVDEAQGAAPVLHGREFMAVEYTDTDGNVPKRKILSPQSLPIQTVIGICREPDCGGARR